MVLGAQWVYFSGFSLAYLISPQICHRFVGYPEEETVITYSKAILDSENGHPSGFVCLTFVTGLWWDCFSFLKKQVLELYRIHWTLSVSIHLRELLDILSNAFFIYTGVNQAYLGNFRIGVDTHVLHVHKSVWQDTGELPRLVGRWSRARPRHATGQRWLYRVLSGN